MERKRKGFEDIQGALSTSQNKASLLGGFSGLRGRFGERASAQYESILTSVLFVKVIWHKVSGHTFRASVSCSLSLTGPFDGIQVWCFARILSSPILSFPLVVIPWARSRLPPNVYSAYCCDAFRTLLFRGNPGYHGVSYRSGNQYFHGSEISPSRTWLLPECALYYRRQVFSC